MQDLKEQMQSCVACDLCETRTQVVFGSGSNSPSVMLIGEAPGEEEDKTGTPFVGQVGQKLDSILKYVGLSREDIYITNSVLCRTPNNRTPNKAELDACHWRLQQQIELLKPKVIVLLGKTAVEQIKGEVIKGPLTQFFLEDKWFDYTTNNHNCKLLITYHPSYHLRSPERAYKISLPHWTKLKNWVENEQ